MSNYTLELQPKDIADLQEKMPDGGILMKLAGIKPLGT